MLLNMFKGKIHRAIVTEANLNYVGSVTIDSKLYSHVDIEKLVKIMEDHIK